MKQNIINANPITLEEASELCKTVTIETEIGKLSSILERLDATNKSQWTPGSAFSKLKILATQRRNDLSKSERP